MCFESNTIGIDGVKLKLEVSSVRVVDLDLSSDIELALVRVRCLVADHVAALGGPGGELADVARGHDFDIVNVALTSRQQMLV